MYVFLFMEQGVVFSSIRQVLGELQKIQLISYEFQSRYGREENEHKNVQLLKKYIRERHEMKNDVKGVKLVLKYGKW